MTYTPRFMNDLVAAQYKAAGEVNIPKNLSQNGGEIRQGDASTRKDEGRKSNPSPTRTREELVEVIAAANRTVTRNGIQLSVPRSLLCAIAALDALIAIGAVRVK